MTNLDYRTELVEQMIRKYHSSTSPKKQGRPKQIGPLRLTERQFPDFIPSTEKKSEAYRRCARATPRFKKKPEGEGRGKWSEDSMKALVASVLESKMAKWSASDHYYVPRSTLQRRIKAILNNLTDMKPQLGYFNATFEDRFEAQLVEHMIVWDSRLMPLTLVFDLAKTLNLPHRFNKQRKMAGKDFYVGFMLKS
ncbi:hypothetical protein QE152_g33430 [Popillia japonica]|uniref:Uncharacterized protein n=1 Tax=Popillia japonica TaxID=7064 RepID=A0AAW1IX34_POPJA